jgi:hypothetical protein
MRKGQRFHLLLASMIAAAMVLGAGGAAIATTTGGGSLAGTLTFGSGYPCSGCTGGAISATVVASLSGLPQSGLAYTATWPDPRTPPPGAGNFQAGFVYTNQCDVTEPVPPLRGFGSGSFTLSGGLLVVNGTAYDNATLSGNFSWQWQGGTTMAITLTGLNITGGSGPSPVAVSLSLDNLVVGAGAMSFAWTNGPGNCAVQNTWQTAEVVASFVQPA